MNASTVIIMAHFGIWGWFAYTQLQNQNQMAGQINGIQGKDNDCGCGSKKIGQGAQYPVKPLDPRVQ